MRRIALAMLYFGVVSPVGLAIRLVRDPLRRRWEPDAASYWQTPRPGARRRPLSTLSRPAVRR